MSKYPGVILFRHNNYSQVDSHIEENKENLMCTIHITNNIEDLNKLFNPNYHILVTYGNSYDEYHNCIASKLPQRFSGRWFHKTDISNIDEFNHNVNYCFVTNVINCRQHTRPVFSIFTTCFKSYDYIKTAYESIKKQSLIDWEWVIMDDTPEDSHFDFLKNVLSADNRVRLYNRDKNSGNIGNVKNEVISLCRGKYILEMDHDDEILENCLTDAYNIFQTDEQIGFVYGDTIHLYRDGKNYKFNDFICKGYGGYYMEKINDNWVYVYNTPNINNITLSHLVCLPNHPRIWKRSVLMELESYSEFLPICDDYEILLRTCCSKYKVAKNNKAQYIQYANDDGNNFSSIRNSEINRIGPKYISPMFYKKYGVHDKMKDLDAYEEESYITNHSPIWKRGEKYQHKKMNQRINFNYDNQYCIINDAIDTPETMERVRELYKNGRNDFLMLSNRMTHEELQHKLESHGFDRMKCYSYTDCSEEELINYFKMMYKNDNCESEIIHSIKDNENNIDTNKIKHRVFIIHNNRKGGVDKYVSDIMNVYNNNEYIFIENKEMLYNQNYTEDDKLFIQNLLYCDIKIEDILSLYNTFHYKIIIAIHDFIWLCQDQHNYTSDIPSAYLSNDISVSNEVKQLLSISDKVLMNSQFTHDVYSSYFDPSNFTLCYPNDYKVQPGIKNIPDIKNECINIGIFSPLCKFKGEIYVHYLKEKFECDTIKFQIVGQNIPYYKETEFYDYIRKYNINGFLMLNEWGETYGYLLTKIINSGLPLLYNNFGAVKERIDSTQEHYFKVYDTECVNDIDPDYNVLDSQFNKFVEYINTNHGTVEDMNEDFTIVTRPVYDELFLYNNYTLHQSTSNDKNDNNTILIYTGFANTLWNYTYLQTNSIGGSEKAVACLGKELSSKYKVIISGDVMDELVDNVQYVNASKLQLLLNTQTFHTIIISRFLCFFEDYPFYSCKNLYICSHDSHGLINRLWNNSAEDINNINNILIKNNKNINGIVALTEWHKNKLIEIYPSIKDKTKIINNGIRLNDFTCDNKKIPNKFIWSSCSNRGLSVLLNMWSNIINVIPGATLDICSYHTFPSSTEDDKINEIILLNNSITHHGQLNTTELYELMSKSEFWLYTNTVDESSCITALEMLMNEVVCLYYPIAGLNDTLGNYGIPVNIGEEIQSILNLTTEKKEALKKQGKEYASSCSWKNRANEWTKMIDSYKEPWVFYHSSHFLGAMVEQYIDNLNSIYPEYFIYLTNNREELLINQPKKITFVYEIFDTEIIKSLPNTQFSFLNTEPLNIPVRLEHTINILKLYPNFEYYDYSQSNLKILEKNGINIQDKIYLPYKCTTHELTTLINLNKNTKKEYDFGIINGSNGVNIDRRQDVVTYLKQINYTINIISGWNDDRDMELAKCKTILNIHGFFHIPSNIFEHIRCDRLLEAGFNILSETSYKLDEEFTNKYPNLKQIEYSDFFNIDVINNILTNVNIPNKEFIQNQPKIIDCFIFYNEIDMLTYRLNILNDIVDYFVLVESTHTFVGKEKPLFYKENKQLFEKFNHKIIHIIVDDFPHKYPNIDFEKKEQWNNEKFQRNCISRGIDKLELNNQDIIIIADVDEIPKIELLGNIKYNEIKINEVKALQMDFYYYNLHSKLDHYTDVVRILPYDIYQNINMTIDDLRFKYYKNFITNAGWHLSYFGDKNFIKNKIENFAHQELNIDLFTNQEKIHNRIKNTQDLFDRPTSIINIPIEDNDNLPPAYDIYLTNFYTDSIQNIRSTLVKYSNLRDNICKFENYDDYINWQIKTGRSFEKDNNKWMNGQRKCVEHNFDTMDRNSKILDICCGDGQGLKKFKEMGFKHVYGVEVCKDKINFAKQYGYTIYDCDICSGPFDIGDNYDCIYSSHTIEHVLNPEYTIRNIMTKLKNDGKFILILPYPDYAAGNTTNEHNFKVHCGVIPLGLHINDKGTTLINKIQQMGYKVVDYKFESYREPEIQLIITK
jgi:beta-1,4-mannosyl-glycoprotein beta-1,4-N-acetylglucosaminyltransferase